MEWSTQLIIRFLRRFAIGMGRLGLGSALLALLLAYFFAGDIYDYKDTVDGTHLPKVDAIVCLAGGRGRIAAAGDLWYRYWELSHQKSLTPVQVPVLYFSGMGRQVNWNLLSKQLRSGVLQVLRPENVVIEKESTNTDANARWLARFASDKHWKVILLLTSSYHMKRSRFIFDHVLKTLGTSMAVETFSVYQEPFGAEEWRSGPNGTRVTLIEYIKWIYYRTMWGTSESSLHP